MQYNNDCYKSKDRSLEVEFLFVKLNRGLGWRAYILSNIDYGSRSSCQTDVHRLSESNEYRAQLVKAFMYNNSPLCGAYNTFSDIEYVCWTNPVATLDKMKTIASAWVDITAYYIRYGGSFPEIQKKLTQQGVI